MNGSRTKKILKILSKPRKESRPNSNIMTKEVYNDKGTNDEKETNNHIIIFSILCIKKPYHFLGTI